LKESQFIEWKHTWQAMMDFQKKEILKKKLIVTVAGRMMTKPWEKGKVVFRNNLPRS